MKELKMMFLGAPGSGKGTQSAAVSERYSIPAVSTGSIIRENIKNKTEIGIKAEAVIAKGELLSDEIVLGMLLDRLKADDCRKGYILDGFPRNLTQAKLLEDNGINLDAVVNIVADDELICERMTGRRVCPKCDASYHITDNKPAKDGICDKCGTALVIRADDNPEVVKNRLKVYHEQTEPLIEFYNKKNILINIVSQKEVAKTKELVSEGLEALLK